MAARIVGMPDWQFLDEQGAVLAGGTLTFYEPGTSTSKTIYQSTDTTGSTHTNPHTLDSSGRPTAPIFADGMYDVVVKDSDGNTIRTISSWGDNSSAVLSDSGTCINSNGSFETDSDGDNVPDSYTQTLTAGDTAQRVTDENQHGTASLKITSQNSDSYMTSDKFEVTPKQELVLSFLVKADNAAASPKIDINWYDSSQSSISTSTVYHDNVGLTPTSWTHKYGLNVTPPATARYFDHVIYGNTSGTTRTVHFDDVCFESKPLISSESPFQPYGLTLSRDTDTDHDLNITAGSVKSDDFTDNIVLPSEITKQADAAFAEGDDAGGLFSGSSLPASGMIAVWLIKNPTTGHVDVGFDSSFTSPTLPAGYTSKRLIGGWVTDASNNFIGGTHKGTRFIYHSSTNDVDDSATSTGSEQTATVTCPPNCVMRFSAVLTVTTGDHTDYGLVIYSTDQSSPSAIEDAYNGMTLEVRSGTARLETMVFSGEVFVDSSSQIHWNIWFDGTQPTAKINMYEWDMLTRDNP